MTAFARRSRQRSRGQAMAEMAIAVPVFFLVIMAIIEGGAFAFTLTTLEHAAQRGGRMAALDPCPPTNPSCSPGRATETDVQNAVIAEAAIATVTVAAADVVISVNGCATSTCFTARVAGDRVRVVVSYTYRPLTSLVFGGSASFPMTAATEYEVE